MGYIKYIPWISILFMIFVFVGVYIDTSQHEKVHKLIYEDYNISGEIEIEWLGDGHFYPKKRGPSEMCELANEMNEAVGYNLGSIYYIIAVGFFFLIMIKELELKIFLENHK